MRILKRTLLILGVLLILFLSIGLFNPSFEYGNEVTVNASPLKCWEVYHDTTLMKSWIEGFQSLILVNGEHLTQGAQYKFIIIDDEKMVMDQQIKLIQAPKKKQL